MATAHSMTTSANWNIRSKPQSSASTQDSVVSKSTWKTWDLQTQHSVSLAQKNRLPSTFIKFAPFTKKIVVKPGHMTPHFTPGSGGLPTNCKGWPTSPTPMDLQSDMAISTDHRRSTADDVAMIIAECVKYNWCLLSVQSTNCVFLHVCSGHQLVVEFNAHKEKLMKEKITLRSATNDNVLFLIFHARVLGKCSVCTSMCAILCTDRQTDTHTHAIYNTCVHPSSHGFWNTHTCTHTCIDTHTHMHAHIHMCSHPLIDHTPIGMHRHTQTPPPPPHTHKCT